MSEDRKETMSEARTKQWEAIMKLGSPTEEYQADRDNAMMKKPENPYHRLQAVPSAIDHKLHETPEYTAWLNCSEAMEAYYQHKIQEIHDYLDKMNGDKGNEIELCLFCHATTFLGNGIDHREGCVILRLRHLQD